MIRIRIDVDDAENKRKLDALADEHWSWVKNFIEYDKQPGQIQNDAKRKRNQDLRNILGDVYSELENIIKADITKMSNMTKAPKYQKFVINVDKLNELQKEYDELEEKFNEQKKRCEKMGLVCPKPEKDILETIQINKEEATALEVLIADCSQVQQIKTL